MGGTQGAVIVGNLINDIPRIKVVKQNFVLFFLLLLTLFLILHGN